MGVYVADYSESVCKTEEEMIINRLSETTMSSSMTVSELTLIVSVMKFITGIKYIFRLTTPYVYVSHV